MWYYEKRERKKTTGGIKAQSKRGNFGATWWGQRWVAVLESFHLDARLQRGRSYARSGQVLNIDITPGRVDSQVQGSFAKPYKISIQLPVLSKKDWADVVTELAKSAANAAKLLAGEMPQEVEEAFEKHKVPLFPARHHDLKTSCSCPDYSNPCKHIAAVFLLLAEEFDRDPFLLFRLRGKDRDALLTDLGALSQVSAEEPTHAEPPAEPLPAEPALFWAAGEVMTEVFGELGGSSESAALLRRLGNFPFWRGERPLLESLETVYRRASVQGETTFVGG